jgi:hypothetical protein
MHTLIRLTALTALVASTGCAFGTREAVLSYPPEADDGGGLIASAHAEEGIVPRAREIVLKVSDERAERDRIGNVRNGFGMDTANVVTKDDVAGWVEGALAQELTNAGYTVVAAGADASRDDAIGLTAEIVEVYCDVYMTYDGDVALMITLEGPEAKPVRTQIEGHGGVGINWAATGKSYAESLALALQDAIEKVLAELAKLG